MPEFNLLCLILFIDSMWNVKLRVGVCLAPRVVLGEKYCIWCVSCVGQSPRPYGCSVRRQIEGRSQFFNCFYVRFFFFIPCPVFVSSFCWGVISLLFNVHVYLSDLFVSCLCLCLLTSACRVWWAWATLYSFLLYNSQCPLLSSYHFLYHILSPACPEKIKHCIQE